MVLPVAVAELIGTFIEALCFGAYIVILPRCVNILRKRDLSRGLALYLFATEVASFLLICLHMGVDLARAFMAFTGNMSIPDSPEKFYGTVNTALNMTKNSAYVSVTLLADLLLVYRTFIVWGRNIWIVIFPACVFCVDFAMSVWCTWSLKQAAPGKSVLIDSVFERLQYFYIATIVLNVVCTGLISFRIWRIQRKVTKYNSESSRGANVLSIVFESAAIYSALLVCLLGTSASGSASGFFFLNSMPPIIGCVFSYVIIRSSADNRRYDSELTLSMRSGDRMAADNRMSRMPPTRSGDAYPERQGVMVHLEQIVHHDGEPDSEEYSQKDSKAFQVV